MAIVEARKRKEGSTHGNYLAAIVVVILIRNISQENDFLWNIFPGITLPLIAFLLATAISIWVCVRHKKNV